MRNHVLIVTISFLFGAKLLSAQEFVPDTIKPVAAEVKFYATLDSLHGDTIYTIKSPKGYVISSYKLYEYTIYIALASKKGYDVFNADPCSSMIDRISSVGDYDLDGRGNPELELGWSSSMGRSGWVDGWSESYSGIIIWNLDKRQMLFCMQDHYEYNYWYNGVEYDSLGNFLEDSLGNIVMNDSFSGSEHSCENFDVNLELKKISIQRSPDCPYDEEEGATTSNGIDVYDVTRYGLILRAPK